MRNRPQTLWRYREALPIPPTCDVVFLGEPLTPLLPWPALPGSHLKLEFLLPTGSFMDRGAGLMLSHMKGLGVRLAVEDISGNAAAAGGLPVGETPVIPLTGSGLKAGTTIAELLKRQR